MGNIGPCHGLRSDVIISAGCDDQGRRNCVSTQRGRVISGIIRGLVTTGHVVTGHTMCMVTARILMGADPGPQPRTAAVTKVRPGSRVHMM